MTAARTIRQAVLLCGLALALAACSSLPRMPYTAADAANARVLDLDGLRRYADEPASKFKLEKSDLAPIKTYLALSGGGADGAYGVGVLNGWTAAGNRPAFSVVSGVSTGGLIAPFAFLGPRYDDTLKEVYTSGVAESLLQDPSLMQVLFGSGLFGNKRLRELVARYVGPEILSEVARENAKGRKLLIVTTDLDTQRTVIWDMGRIAAVGTPEALQLFRDVMAASASIPLVFPPIMIDAEGQGRRFQEMHVDGGVTAPVLTLPDALLFRERSWPANGRMNIYILVNKKLEGNFELVSNSTIDVASRSISAITQAQTRSVILSTYDFARRNRLGFHLSYIERDYPAPETQGFDTAYMRALYQYGYDKAAAGQAWTATPP
ncbi:MULTISPECIES: patatin-like phospholipase family protein [Bradyrhizobium]|jgi:predicted patatin/cPLA2 family phospholipase|uniref:patatin-like phospholipase family protein n=1 Tax=Bradyrhizobium TaxID=374 RepID=UPI0004850A15|nr:MULTISPECIES: patatin-like phospholipase family protein [Bradyrhizobium]MCS3449317.1 putative patatin/cPLA2 family phospholipase [Bradyrhizobium elkanii]MCS3559540.1 putative patatin/cPLA2 family phospholipase [Bradyrhizobium elkanii]MCW2150614.1 putative patatin/cPLA2 family phospholipase [Bradyrhizobium elkanii]MCW2359328.1 putative patatin/cPLA2 family phospholipase [Bradyrhizobium elkanii]MCW2374345.1 putative patatin/cPLA2 family phospholipase [Bradyrhizobium elkanii]